METDLVRAQLDRMLASATFTGAVRHSRLLRYVVERTLAGEGDQLKEYVLGVEVFDRPSSYDPRLDTIVRVEARRLRARLDEYYGGPGAFDPVTISIPRGSYMPEFLVRGTSEAPLAAPALSHPSPSSTTHRRARVPIWLVLIAGALVVAAAGVLLMPGRPPAAQAAAGPGIAVLPFDTYTTQADVARTAAAFTDAVTSDLAALGTVSVASRTTTRQYETERPTTPAIREALGVDFLLEGTLTVSQDTLKVVMRLVDAERDRKVWVREYQESAADLESLSRRIAREAATAAVTYIPRQ